MARFDINVTLNTIGASNARAIALPLARKIANGGYEPGDLDELRMQLGYIAACAEADDKGFRIPYAKIDSFVTGLYNGDSAAIALLPA